MDPLSSFFCHSVDAVFFLPLPTIIISSSFFFIVFVFFFFSALMRSMLPLKPVYPLRVDRLMLVCLFIFLLLLFCFFFY